MKKKFGKRSASDYEQSCSSQSSHHTHKSIITTQNMVLAQSGYNFLDSTHQSGYFTPNKHERQELNEKSQSYSDGKINSLKKYSLIDKGIDDEFKEITNNSTTQKKEESIRIKRMLHFEEDASSNEPDKENERIVEVPENIEQNSSFSESEEERVVRRRGEVRREDRRFGVSLLERKLGAAKRESKQYIMQAICEKEQISF